MIDRQKIIQIFKASPTPTSIILVDDPNFTFLQVNEAYTKMAQIKEENLIGKSLFEVFPENPEEVKPTGVEQLINSFRKVIAEKSEHEMDQIRYDIKLDDNEYKEIYWKVINTPVPGDDGEVEFIINSAQNITDQVLSERSNKLMLNNTEDSFILIDRDLIVQNFNDLFAEHYQEIFNIEVKKGVSILEYAQPERHDILKGIYERVFKGETIVGEIPAVTPEGNTRFFTIKYKPAENKHGEIIGSFVSLLEKTDEHLAKLELKKNEEKFRNVVEHSTNMFYQHDLNGVLNYVSPQSREFLGYSPEHAKRNWQDFITDHPINREGEKLTQKALETGEIQEPYELQLITKDNRIIWVEVHEAPLIKDDQVVGIVGSLTDITDRKKYEKQLKQSLERYDYVSKASRDAIYDWDITNNNIHWGEGYATLFGHKAGEDKYPIRNWEKLVHSDDLEKTRLDLNFTLEDSSINKWTSEYRLKKAKGGYAYVLENGYIIRNEDGKAIRMIGALRDVTESKQNEIQNEIQREIAKFFKGQKNLKPTLEQVLKYLANYGKFETAEIWLKSSNNNHQNLIASYALNRNGEAFYKNSKDIQQFIKGEGLPGTVWDSNEIEIWDNVGSNPSFIRRNAAKKTGIRSAFGIPLFHNQELTGVLLLSSAADVSSSTQILKLFEGLQKFLGAEIKRKQQEEEFQLLFESAPEILAVAAPNGHFVRVNPAFCKLLGYAEEELTSQPFENFLHPEDREDTLKEYDETKTGERHANNFVNRYVTKSGKIVYISWYSSDTFGEDELVFAYGRDVSETKELEHLLKLTNRLAKVGSWKLDLKNEKLYWSQVTKDIHEVEPNYEPDLEAAINFYIEGENRDTIRQVLQEAIEQGKPFDEELELITAKGNPKWVRAKGEPEMVDGKCIQVYGSLQDIQDRKQAQIKMKGALEERQRILERINEAFFAVDNNSIVTYWNKKAEEITGVTKEELIGNNLWEVFPEAIDLKFFEEFQSALKEQKSVTFEDFYPPLGKWFEAHGYPSQEGLSAFFRDVTDRKQAEIDLKEAFKEKDTILESIGDGFFTLDKNWNVTYWNRAAERLLQTPKHVILNQNLWDIFEEATDLPSYTNYHKVMHERVSVNFEDYYAPIDKWFDVNAYPSAEGISVFFKDITERKKASEKLEQLNAELKQRADELAASNAELEQFAYVASHDLQEPLRMVTSFLTQLDKKYADKLDEKANEYIHFAVDGAQRMRQIILDLLDYSRLNRDQLKREKVDLNEVVESAKSLERTHIEEVEAEIKVEKLPTVLVNPGPIKQVFKNLLSNALKYRKPGVPVKIKITAEETEDYWKIAFSDNGIGINPEFKETIFQIFQRLHTRDQYSGTGIGLAISKKIIERHGGEIWVESEEGKGSTFYFTLQK